MPTNRLICYTLIYYRQFIQFLYNYHYDHQLSIEDTVYSTYWKNVITYTKKLALKIYTSITSVYDITVIINETKL